MADATEPMIIPFADLADDTLQRVIESFVLREGTDYGLHEAPLTSKVLQVRRQLERGDAWIVFDAESSTIDIVLSRDTHRRTR